MRERKPGQGRTMRGEVLFEFVPMGASVRVSALCADTLLEVVVQAPASLSRDQLEALALRKLEAMKRRASSTIGPHASDRKEAQLARPAVPALADRKV